ncbi:MAG: hypothetical protein ACYS80_27785 [Planctomycetota bacterium]
MEEVKKGKKVPLVEARRLALKILEDTDLALYTEEDLADARREAFEWCAELCERSGAKTEAYYIRNPDKYAAQRKAIDHNHELLGIVAFVLGREREKQKNTLAEPSASAGRERRPRHERFCFP